MPKLNSMISDIMEWIDINIEKPLRIDDIAKKSGYSKWHLQRVFSREKKVTIACYIRNRKLFLAANDLVATNESVLCISIKYGFDSQQSFTKAFSRRFQIPPAKFRMENKSDKL